MSLFDPFYRHIARPLFFQIDPEKIHDWMMAAIPKVRPLKPWIKKCFAVEDPRLQQQIWGLTFPNPLGLAGGFDKNAECADLWDLFGFGFVELGTVTPNPQPGNPRPRLFRFPARQALVNRMGFNNEGAQAIAARLRQNAENGWNFPGITGISIGKQFSTPVEQIDLVIADYMTCLEVLYPVADYFAVNISSPNTKNLRVLQQVESLDHLLSALLTYMKQRAGEGQRKPLCVKFAPDLDNEAIEAGVAIAMQRGIDGIIATNTTNQTGEVEQGGLSGAPLRKRATEVIRRIAKQTEGRLPIIGSGGVFTAEDAIEKFQAGAWVIQLYTGFVYNGPSCTKQIHRGLLEYMQAIGLQNLAQLRQTGAVSR